jgi:hypothetical protein
MGAGSIRLVERPGVDGLEVEIGWFEGSALAGSHHSLPGLDPAGREQLPWARSQHPGLVVPVKKESDQSRADPRHGRESGAACSRDASSGSCLGSR